jgi:iron complex transport system substrate-binding protein
MIRTLILLAGWAACAQALAVAITDDRGRTFERTLAPQRIVSLSPHLAEVAFAVGAGDRLVGVSAFTDYPEQAAQIPVIANNGRVDLERLVALKPDLVLAWQSGNPARDIERLERLGFAVFVTEARRLADIPRVLRLVGRALGGVEHAERAARDTEARIAALERRAPAGQALPVFVEIWHQPLITVSGEHLISDALRLCGGRNVFSGARLLTLAVSREALLAARPQAVIMSSGAGTQSQQAARWRDALPSLPAVKNGALHAVDPALLHRQGPRLLEAAEVLCGKLDLARQAAGTLR